jgi:Fe-S cluster biogenesis protein NfuA
MLLQGRGTRTQKTLFKKLFGHLTKNHQSTTSHISQSTIASYELVSVLNKNSIASTSYTESVGGRREFSSFFSQLSQRVRYQPLRHGSIRNTDATPKYSHSRGMSMFIQTQNTPNPTSLMFIPTGKPVLSGEKEKSKNFSNAREAMASPLAKKLFLIDGVTQVFFASDFVTVSKDEDASWSVLKPEIFAAMTEFYTSNEPILYEYSDDPDVAKKNNLIQEEEDDEVVAMIKELLETRIRPAVQEDGGDIVFCEFDHDCGVVTLKMMGACSGCPSSSVTLKSGIENMLMHYIPEVKGVVEADADEAEVESDKAFQRLEQHLST